MVSVRVLLGQVVFGLLRTAKVDLLRHSEPATSFASSGATCAMFNMAEFRRLLLKENKISFMMTDIIIKKRL